MRLPSIDVLVLAAGRGERLRPLTDHTPKPLVKVGGKALLEWNLEMLAKAGFRRVIINLFYLGEQIEAFVGNGSRFGLQVEYSKEPVLLDTGGAIKYIEPRLTSDCLMTINSDILLGSDFSFESLVKTHLEDQRLPLATLALRADKDAEGFGVLELDETRKVIRFLDVRAPISEVQASPGVGEGVERTPVAQGTSGKSEVKPSQKLMYMGVQVLSRRLFQEMPEAGSVFSITRDIYRRVVLEGGLLAGLTYDGYWSDIGTPLRLDEASKWISVSKKATES